MTDEQTGILVFKDQAGEYYLLPQETLEQGRVPAEHKAEIERLINEQQDDVQGHYAFLAGIVVGIASVAAGALIGTASDTDTYLQRMREIYDRYN